MCREDIRMGRKMSYAFRTVTIANGATEIIAPANRNRVFLSFWGIGGTTLAAAGEVAPSATVGIVSSSNIPPHEFYIGTHGGLTTTQWRAFSNGAQSVVSVMEAFYDDGVWP